MANIKYVLNDPTTPQLISEVKLPPKPKGLSFKVGGYKGTTNDLYSLEHQAACAHYSIANAINLFNKTLDKPVKKWAATNTLYIQPRAGRQLNAYYDRRALRFFYGTDPIAKKTVFTANSADIVLHELGHAILDAVRPDLFNTQAMEVWAFHEAFGDIHAMINILQHDEIVNHILEETKNNLKKSNNLTKLAEEMGTAIFHVTRGSHGHTAGFLRNAVNGFKYVRPETLPRNTKHNQLSSEPHSFSRVFTGAWYDILVAIYEYEKNTNKLTPKDALIKARNVLTTYTFRCLRMAPATIRFYNAVARAMLVEDKGNGYAYNKLMNQVFMKRKILRKPVKPFASLDWLSFKDSILDNDEVFEESSIAAVRSKKVELLALPDYMVNVETPADTYHEFDENGKCIDTIVISPDELVDHAHDCVAFLKENDMIRPDKLAPFEIDDEGNLIRSHFAVCFNTNATNPEQPEFNKFFKPENNSGCGCNVKPVGNVCEAEVKTATMKTTPASSCTTIVNGSTGKVIKQRITRF